jgi:hypothetical protein
MEDETVVGLGRLYETVSKRSDYDLLIRLSA